MTRSGKRTMARRHRVAAPVLAFAMIAVSVAFAGAILESERLGPNLLLSGVFLAGLAVGALSFMALQGVTGARWSESFRAIPARLSSMLPVAAALLMLVFVVRPETYSWTVDKQPELRGAWLSMPFFVGRTIVYFALWMLSARLLVRRTASTGTAAAVLTVSALTVWLAASDWLMSLTPQWASTIFSVYVFVGFIVSSLAAILVVCVYLRARRPTCQFVSVDQLHDLAKCLFGFSSLWMYLWYCQYMLIWYTNQPHETGYFIVRTGDSWRAMFFLVVALKWAVPFALLLGRAGKRSLAVLALASFSVLLGQWLDLYVLIFPGVAPNQSTPGLLEVGTALGIGAAGLRVLRDSKSSERASVARAVR